MSCGTPPTRVERIPLPQVEGLPALLRKLNATDPAEFDTMEKRILAMRDTHFTPRATVDHISRFVIGRPNDLVCQKIPRSVRDA